MYGRWEASTIRVRGVFDYILLSACVLIVPSFPIPNVVRPVRRDRNKETDASLLERSPVRITVMMRGS